MDFSVNFAAEPVHVGEWITLITSAGITVMNDEMVSQMDDPSFGELSLDLDEWELPTLSTDWDDSFDLVPPGLEHQGPPHPLPKVKPHARIVRPRVEPLLGLQNGAPTRKDNSACRWYFLSRQPNKAWWPGLLKTSAKAYVAVLDF